MRGNYGRLEFSPSNFSVLSTINRNQWYRTLCSLKEALDKKVRMHLEPGGQEFLT